MSPPYQRSLIATPGVRVSERYRMYPPPVEACPISKTFEFGTGRLIVLAPACDSYPFGYVQ
eukprot:3065363-Pleurochrysis_carterae.AAC.1